MFATVAQCIKVIDITIHVSVILSVFFSLGETHSCSKSDYWAFDFSY